MFKIVDGREHFYQWDLNRQIQVEDNTITQLHFCNRTDDCSLVVEVVDGVANVPNILLQNTWDIRVYGYTGDYTKVEKRYKVVARTKPTDYVYTETEIKNYEDLQGEIDALREIGVGLGERVDELEVGLQTTADDVSDLYYEVYTNIPANVADAMPGIVYVDMDADNNWCEVNDLCRFNHTIHIYADDKLYPENRLTFDSSINKHVNGVSFNFYKVDQGRKNAIRLNGTATEDAVITLAEGTLSFPDDKIFYGSVLGSVRGYGYRDGMELLLYGINGEYVGRIGKSARLQNNQRNLSRVDLKIPKGETFKEFIIEPMITDAVIEVRDGNYDELLHHIPLYEDTADFDSKGVDCMYLKPQDGYTLSTPVSYRISYHRALSNLVDLYDENYFVFCWGDRQYTVADSSRLEEALDKIINIQESLMGNAINFVVLLNGQEYVFVAANGMSWAEWCDSAYNTDGFYIDGDCVHYNNGDYVGYDDVQVYPTDLIVEGQVYDGGM